MPHGLYVRTVLGGGVLVCCQPKGEEMEQPLRGVLGRGGGCGLDVRIEVVLHIVDPSGADYPSEVSIVGGRGSVG